VGARFRVWCARFRDFGVFLVVACTKSGCYQTLQSLAVIRRYKVWLLSDVTKSGWLLSDVTNSGCYQALQSLAVIRRYKIWLLSDAGHKYALATSGWLHRRWQGDASYTL